MAIDKRILAAGGIAAVAGALTLGQLDQPKLETMTAAQEIKLAIPGQEIKALRSESSETFKINDYKLKTKVYAQKKYYFETKTETYEKPDLTVNEINVLAKINPFRSHDKYVDAGFYSAAWLNSDEADYKINDSKSGYVKFNTLHKPDGIAVFKQVSEKGIKQSYIILEPRDDSALRWLLDASGEMLEQKDGSVRVSGSDIVISAPIAWDNKNNPVKVTVKVSGDTLIFETDLRDAVFPVTIDPTTLIVSDTDAMTGQWGASNYATWDLGRNITTEPNLNAGAVNVGVIITAGSAYQVRRSMYRFDSSSLPDEAIIDSVLFKQVLSDKSNLSSNAVLHFVEAQDTVSTSYLTQAMFSRLKGWKTSGVYEVSDITDSLSVPTTSSVGDTLISRFNSNGKLKVNKTGTTQFYGMHTRDIYNIATTSSSLPFFEDDSPYLMIYYSLPPGLILSATATQAISGTVSHFHPSTYTGARDTTTSNGAISDFTANGPNWVGQYKTSGQYTVGRSLLSFDLAAITAADTVSKVELWWYGFSDSSTTNFNIYGVKSTKSGALSREWFNDFNGWAASGAYSTVNLTDVWNSVGYVAGWNVIPFTTAGKDTVSAHRTGTLEMAMLSGNDISNTAPTGNEYITIGGAAFSPYLKVFLTGLVPQGVTVTSISADSLLVSWTDKTGDETGFRIISGASTAIDSTAADATSKRVGGLSINTLYTLKVQVKGGVLNGQYSATDQCYTRANIPGAVTVTVVADSLMKFAFSVNSNPAITEFAIQDSLSGKYVQRITGIDTLGASANWATFANWGGASGDTIIIKPGKKYVLRAKARSGE